MRFKFADESAATRFFGAYRSLLEKKDENRTNVSRRQNFYSLSTPDNGGAFLRCYGQECLIAEGTTADVFDAMTKAIHWPAPGPATPESDAPGVTVMQRHGSPALPALGSGLFPPGPQEIVPYRAY
jgi:hypothetical protein